MDWQGYLISISTRLILSLLVPYLLLLSTSVYKLKVENVISLFNIYSNFKKYFLVLKKELYKFYIQVFVVFVAITSFYIWAALFIKPEEEFLSYIIVISIIYIICLL